MWNAKRNIAVIWYSITIVCSLRFQGLSTGANIKLDTLTQRSIPGLKAPKKLWWTKEITPELHVAGGLTARQIKYAYEGGFKSIISLYSEANPGNYGSESLATTSEGENIANITGMQFETILNDNEDCASLTSIQKLSGIISRVQKPILLYSSQPRSIAFATLMHLAYQSRRDPHHRPQVNSEKIYQMGAVMGMDFTAQTSKSVVAEITGEPIVENPIKPNVIPSNWLGYWLAHPVYKNWFTAGQIRKGHLKEIQYAGFKSVINMRQGITHNGNLSQEPITLINIQDNTPTYDDDYKPLRQLDTTLQTLVLDSTRDNTYISPTSAVNYESRNVGEYGDDVGFNEELEGKDFKISNLKYYHLPLGSPITCSPDIFKQYKDILLEIGKQGPVLFHCATGRRADFKLPTWMTYPFQTKIMETKIVKDETMVNRKSKETLLYLGHLPSIVLVVALGLGLYTQWQYTENDIILGFVIFGFFILVISFALKYKFNCELIGLILLHIWLGCILGIIIFSSDKKIEFIMTQEVANVLLITSAVLTWCWNLLERMLHFVKHEAKMFTPMQILESIGLIISTLVTGKDAISFSILILAFNCNLAAIRLKSFLGLLSFILMMTISTVIIFRDVSLASNYYGLACFVARHSFEPFIDLYFSGLTTLQRWQPFFSLSRLSRYSFILLVFAFNIATGAVIGKLSANHKEWYVVVPLTVFFACIWLCFHLMYFITCWKLMSRISECNLTYHSLTDERKNMGRIMASKGVRHFSLISQRLIFITLLTTIILGALSWETRTSYSLSMVLLVLPVECLTLSLFWYLGDNLGGTATGYAVIAPVTGQKGRTRMNLMSQEAVQDMGTRATTTLNKVSHFFNFHMIDNYGCDYSTSGLAMDYLESKLRAFFDRRMSDGPKYDTYILYFSGDVYENGEWAMSDNRSLKLEVLLEWWSSKNTGTGSRLILILDTTHSYMWAKEVQRVWGEYVAIQTCTFQKPIDPEYGNRGQVGSFTQDWVHYNEDADIYPGWSDKERTVRAVYKVSKCWTDFTFHLPTVEDIHNHWDSSFPKCMKPLIKAVNIGGAGSLCFCCQCVTRCLKRKRMKWLPPKQVDTGHGFKLIRS